MTFNCRSLRSKVPQVLDIALENKVDILLLQETWLRKSDSALLAQINEYNFEIFQVRKRHKVDLGGGVAIIFNKSLKIKQIKVKQFLSFEVVGCSLETVAEEIDIFTLYYPGYSTKHKYTYLQFLSELSDFFSLFCTQRTVLVTGDFNIHFEDLERNETKLFSDILYANNLNQIITEPTHSAGGILDFVLINDDLCHRNLISNIQIATHNEVSDHRSICFNLKVSK